VFNPNGNEIITLAGRDYQVQPLNVGKLAATPPALRIIHGARAEVFQLRDTSTNTLLALKVMRPPFRKPALIRNRALLAQLSNVRGFEACQLTYFTPQSHPNDLAHYPDLEYASLMPWIGGMTWSSVLDSRTQFPINDSTSWKLAYDLLVSLTVLERNHTAHCDLGSNNVIVDLQNPQTTLIDFDEVYWPDAPVPAGLPTGTPGYRRGTQNQWKASGDRFATAILVAELLGWRNAQIQNRSSGESFFSEAEYNDLSSARYLELQEFLDQLDSKLGSLFRKAWNAHSTEVCPSIQDWRRALAEAQHWKAIPLDYRDAFQINWSAVKHDLANLSGQPSGPALAIASPPLVNGQAAGPQTQPSPSSAAVVNPDTPHPVASQPTPPTIGCMILFALMVLGLLGWWILFVPH